jgi:hypothetical protein
MGKGGKSRGRKVSSRMSSSGRTRRNRKSRKSTMVRPCRSRSFPYERDLKKV